MRTLRKYVVALVTTLLLAGCQGAPGDNHVIIRGGTLHDGRGNEPVETDIAFAADRIAASGDLSGLSGTP